MSDWRGGGGAGTEGQEGCLGRTHRLHGEGGTEGPRALLHRRADRQHPQGQGAGVSAGSVATTSILFVTRGGNFIQFFSENFDSIAFFLPFSVLKLFFAAIYLEK